MIEVKNLAKSYGKIRALSSISFEVTKNGIIGLLGPNGAGKTTLIRILTGNIHKNSGIINFLGEELDFEENFHLKKRIGYLAETNPLYEDMSVYSFLKFISELRNANENEIHEIASKTGIINVMNRTIHKLSRGYKQRVGIAHTLIGNPRVLIYDEPTTGLDPVQITEIRELIKKLAIDHIVFICTHIMQEASNLCDRILIMNDGKIINDFTKEEFNNYLSREHKYEAIIQGNKNAMINILKKVKGIKTIKINNKQNDIFSIIINSQIDIRKQVTGKLLKAKIDLIEFKSLFSTLEDLFLKAVK